MSLLKRFQIRSIQVKIVLWAALCVVGVSLAIILYAMCSFYGTAREVAREQVVANAWSEVLDVSAQFEKTLDVTRALAQIMAKTRMQMGQLSQEEAVAMIEGLLAVDELHLAGAYVIWESNAFDGADLDAQFLDLDGRFVAYVVKDQQGDVHLAPADGEQATALADDYRSVAKTMRDSVFEPRTYTIRGNEVHVASFMVPLLDDGQFLGVVGVDLDLFYFQDRIDDAEVYEGIGQMMVFSPKGVLLGVKEQPDLAGKHVQSVYEHLDLPSVLQHGGEYVDVQEDFLYVILPINFDRAVSPWYVGFRIPWDQVIAREDQMKWQFVGIGFASVLVAITVLWFLSGRVVKPISQITEVARSVAQGNLAVSVDLQQHDETGVLADAFNQMVFQLRDMLRSEQDQREYLERSVREYVAYMEEVAQGNLSVRLSVDGYAVTDDPLIVLGRSLNEMVVSLQQMIRQIREAANDLSASSSEILAATTQQSSGASEQSAAISQTTTTVDELKTIAEQSVSRAQEVASASQRTVEVSRRGSETVEETIASMREIKARVESIAENILALSEQTQQIGEIIATVNDIADQSNMLALNASVEAARAGEYGKGFAVVAQEVRNLAEQSQQATAQVKTILSDIQRATNATVMATEEGTKGVDEGVVMAAQAGETIEQLAGVIDESAQAAMQMVAGGRQQAAGVEQVALAMQNINQATAQSLAGTREAEKAARDLNDLSRRLKDIVEQYQL